MTWSQATMLPCASSAELGAVHVRGPVVAALDVVLAAPDQLHRAGVAGRLAGLGDVDRLDHEVRGRHGAPAEAAAGHHRVQRDLLGLQAGGGSGGGLVAGLELRADPQRAAGRPSGRPCS